MQKLSSKGSPRFGEAGGPATGWKTKLKASMLVVTMIILGIMLVSTLSISLVAVQERKASMGENTSNQAYSTAETGVEKVMQLMKNNEGGTLSNIDASCANGVITSTEGYTVKFKDATDNFITDCGTPIALVKSVKSIGTVGQNQRAVEAAVAGTVCDGTPSDIETSDNAAATFKDAQQYCRNKGGCWHIPTMEELTYFDGIAGATSFLWVGNATPMALIWTGNISNNTYGQLMSTSTSKFRCVNCQSSVCSSIPNEIEPSDRAADTIVNAQKTCRGLGSCWHLPALKELAHFSGISGASTSQLWTSTSTFNTGVSSNFTLELDNGALGSNNSAFEQFPNNTLRKYRCVR